MPTPIEYQYDVFISYSHTDAEWVKEQLLPRLEQGGLKVNIDYRDFDIGAPSLVNMERAVDNSRHTLAVLTPAYVASDWTAFEGLLVGTIDPAARQRKLFPLLLKPCQPPRRIAALSYADFTKPQNYAAEFVRLLKQLQDTATVADPSAEAVPLYTLLWETLAHEPAEALSRRPGGRPRAERLGRQEQGRARYPEALPA